MAAELGVGVVSGQWMFKFVNVADDTAYGATTLIIGQKVEFKKKRSLGGPRFWSVMLEKGSVMGFVMRMGIVMSVCAPGQHEDAKTTV